MGRMVHGIADLVSSEEFEVDWTKMSLADLACLWCATEMKKMISEIEDDGLRQITNDQTCSVFETLEWNEAWWRGLKDYLMGRTGVVKINVKNVPFGFVVGKTPYVFVRKGEGFSVRVQIADLLSKIFWRDIREYLMVRASNRLFEISEEMADTLREEIIRWNEDQLWKDTIKPDMINYLRNKGRLY